MKCTPKLNDRKYQVDIKLNYTRPISQLQKKNTQNKWWYPNIFLRQTSRSLESHLCFTDPKKILSQELLDSILVHENMLFICKQVKRGQEDIKHWCVPTVGQFKNYFKSCKSYIYSYCSFCNLYSLYLIPFALRSRSQSALISTSRHSVWAGVLP